MAGIELAEHGEEDDVCELTVRLLKEAPKNNQHKAGKSHHQSKAQHQQNAEIAPGDADQWMHEHKRAVSQIILLAKDIF